MPLPICALPEKPHASPIFHAIQYILGRQTVEKLERFRAMGGAQSYPSRTKDGEDVDFSDVPGLSNELKQKMKSRQPRSIADAQRMEGMTPAALAIIVAHVRNAERAARRSVA